MYNLKKELIYIIQRTHKLLCFECDLKITNLLLGTAATETNLGQTLRQVGYFMNSDEGAFGIWQIELATDKDIWDMLINKRPVLNHKMTDLLGKLSHKDALVGNLYYACAMARLQYSRHKEPLPPAEDIEAQGIYYCKYYNSHKGKGSVEKYIADYKKYVL